MASASDIITYIGIPLAVLGVLPILYTFALSILRQRRIRSLLIQHGHKQYTGRHTREEGFVLRASAMTSLIEVEMPRYTIAPFDREDERYWELSAEGTGCASAKGEEGALLARGQGSEREEEGGGEEGVGRVESTLSMVEEGRVRGFLRGGSWRAFRWKRLVVGRKLYRIQYEDELREPPAEIEFSDLINFLIDWGAELDEMGWEKLRSGGLWTPAGTVLLRIKGEDIEKIEGKDSSIVGGRGPPGRGEWVLRTSMPDDSDGVLTLCCRWPPERRFGAVRNTTSLPPGWGRLRRPETPEEDKSLDTENSLPATIAAITVTYHHHTNTTSFRFKTDANEITKLYAEESNIETGTTLSLSLLSHYPLAQTWFTTSLSSHLSLTKYNGSLWGSTVPSTLSTFLHKDSIPCGILVLLSILPASQAPDWETPDLDPSSASDHALALAHQKRFQARLAAERLESAMPPDQASVHRKLREGEDRRAQHEAMVKHLAAKRTRNEKKVADAIVSPRLGVRRVAEVCLGWLVEERVVPGGWTVVDVAGAVLWLVVCQSQGLSTKQRRVSGESDREERKRESEHELIPVFKVLEEWNAWSVAGGMKREQFEMLRSCRREFCYAACLVAVVAEAVGSETARGRAGVDMLECLRLWRKVRLG